MPTRSLNKTWTRWALLWLVWTFIGLAFAGQLYLSKSKIGEPVSWSFALGRALSDWYVFAVLSFPALFLARRFSLGDAHWLRNMVVHLFASAVFSLFWMTLRAGLEVWLGREVQAITYRAAFDRALVTTFFYNLLIYWVIISVGYAFDYYRKFNAHELRTAELETRLAQARLQALQMQLNPHFLFNTLHAISSLMHKDVEAADAMIARLSELLRYTLESTDAQEVPLQQELEFLDSYLEIQQARFGDRLAVRREIAPETLQARVPNLVLQPLIENAIKHGIAPHSKVGQIVLRAYRTERSLRLEVSDNGAGLPNGQLPEEGVGLSNTRSRLQQLYGDAHRFEFGNTEAGGFLVAVTVPWREDEI